MLFSQLGLQLKYFPFGMFKKNTKFELIFYKSKLNLINQMKNFIPFLGATAIFLAACTNSPIEEKFEGFNLIHQDGPTLGYSPESGVKIIYDGNFAFKDLNRNGKLDVYEDWRKDLEERVTDLANQLSLEEIAGLMLYSSHQPIPADGSYGTATYNGKPFKESGANPWDLSDQQKKFLGEDNVRHVLITAVQSPEVAAKWNNVAQAFVEGQGHGIPNNNSSDPRNGVSAGDSEFTAGAGGDISLWPNEVGLGATFDPELVREYGQIASAEYRALGFATCLSPQIDLGTEPRWYRFQGTYSEDPKLVADIAEAYCDGFQTSTGADALYGAWGLQSVNTMAKHWPGGGPCEAGRDAHYGRGKFAVYPGKNYDLHKIPYQNGAFKLKNGTGKTAAIMPYYTISYGQSDEVVANNYNFEIITRQLREKEGYDGVLCTDWGVTADEVHPGIHSGKPYGMEDKTVAERHLKVLRAGVDQFGGNNDKVPVLEAFQMMIKEDGEEKAMERIRTSARRLLRNIFQTGLFENPYLIPEESAKIVGNPEFMEKGYMAQVKSIVMVKNHEKVLPLKDAKKTKVYIPQRYYPAHLSFWGQTIPADTLTPVTSEMAANYFEVANSPEEADVAVVFIDSPNSGWGHNLAEALSGDISKIKPNLLNLMKSYGIDIPEGQENIILNEYIKNFRNNGVNNFFIPAGSKVSAPGNGYYPISLQYEDYVAEYAREQSIGQGDPFENIANRSYKGKGVRTYNKPDMELVREMRKKMGDKKVIVVVNTSNPFVLSEIEPLADAILITFTIQKQAILDVITGKYEPSGLLPFQMPANMKTVEEQAEDTPRDMVCYKDADGNTYDFAYGLNWSGIINDERVQRYK